MRAKLDNAQTPIIQAENLFIDYKLERGWVNALHDVSLTIRPLEIHGLVGESGSGKSTLALALMRYLASNSRIASGRILLDGDDLAPKTTAEMRHIWGRQISLVPQDALASLNPAYPIGDQIAEITQLHEGLPRKQAWAQAVEMLRRVKIADPGAVAKRYPHQLSGGMQQRVTIAMALSTHPRLLILDEPTTSLDVTTQAVILDLFRELIHDNQAAALYVSHDLGLVAQLCDTVTVLYGGEVMASAPVVDLFKRPLHPYTIGLLASMPRLTEGAETRLPTIKGVAPSLAERPHGCVFSDRCPAALQLCREVKPPLEIIENGRLVKCHRWSEIADGSLVIDTAPQEQNVPAPPRERSVLEVEKLDKHFGQPTLFERLTGQATPPITAVDGVSFNIRERSTLGLVGESGSGKTTLARCIVALESADGGQITLLDVPLSLDLSRRPSSALRELQMVFQNPNDTLNPYMTVEQTLSRTIRRLDSSVSQTDVQQRVTRLLDSVRLTAEYASRYPSELSGGEKQRVAIARAFAANPALVLADEPTSSLDVSVQAVILNLLKDLRAQQGASYLFISHDLRAVSYLADWILVMYLGEIVEMGTSHDVYRAPSHPYTEALVSAISGLEPTADEKRIRLHGDVPSARNLPTGCRFHTRCPRKLGAICETEAPPWCDAGNGHFIRCHIPVDELKVLQQTAPPRENIESPVPLPSGSPSDGGQA
jgi:peptide/nickel transport system ATP-binding protein